MQAVALALALAEQAPMSSVGTGCTGSSDTRLTHPRLCRPAAPPAPAEHDAESDIESTNIDTPPPRCFGKAKSGGEYAHVATNANLSTDICPPVLFLLNTPLGVCFVLVQARTARNLVPRGSLRLPSLVWQPPPAVPGTRTVRAHDRWPSYSSSCRPAMWHTRTARRGAPMALAAARGSSRPAVHGRSRRPGRSARCRPAGNESSGLRPTIRRSTSPTTAVPPTTASATPCCRTCATARSPACPSRGIGPWVDSKPVQKLARGEVPLPPLYQGP